MNEVSTAISFTCEDGRELSGRFWKCAQAKASVLVAPALAVPMSYYFEFCEFLHGFDLNVVTFDYRGIGASVGSTQTKAETFADWGVQDLNSAIAYIRSVDADLPLLHVGHSCGAQLLALARNTKALSASCFVAVSSPYPGHWKGLERFKMWTLFHILIPALSVGRSSFPAKKLGLAGMDVPVGTVGGWARCAREPDYMFSPRFQFSLYAEDLRCPVMYWRFDDDEYATPSAVSAIARHFSSAEIEYRQVQSRVETGKHIGHLGFFNPGRGKPLWDELKDWLLLQLDSRP